MSIEQQSIIAGKPNEILGTTKKSRCGEKILKENMEDNMDVRSARGDNLGILPAFYRNGKIFPSVG